jgi:hypothetical protein
MPETSVLINVYIYNAGSVTPFVDCLFFTFLLIHSNLGTSYLANEFPQVSQLRKLMETNETKNLRNSCPKIQKLAYRVICRNYGNYGNSETMYCAVYH